MCWTPNRISDICRACLDLQCLHCFYNLYFLIFERELWAELKEMLKASRRYKISIFRSTCFISIWLYNLPNSKFY
jgi:hypothetical protein